MAREENAVRIAAELGGTRVNRGQRLGAIFEKVGKARFGIDAVIRDRNDDALAREGLAHHAVSLLRPARKAPP